jgi:hypothetical protein
VKFFLPGKRRVKKLTHTFPNMCHLPFAYHGEPAAAVIALNRAKANPEQAVAEIPL